MLPTICLAYYDDEPSITALDAIMFVIGIFFFILSVVALFKIINIAKDVKAIKEKIEKKDNPGYYYLIGDKEKAKEILTKQMVAELEEIWRKDENNYFNHYYWKKEFERLNLEVPEILKDIKSLIDYKKLFEEKNEQ